MQNWFLLWILKFGCLLTRIRCTRILIKFLFQDKKWQRLQYCNFYQYQHIFAVARWNHPYVSFLPCFIVAASASCWRLRFEVFHNNWALSWEENWSMIFINLISYKLWIVQKCTRVSFWEIRKIAYNHLKILFLGKKL